MGTMLSACGCRCDTDDPPPCDPQQIQIWPASGCTIFGLPMRVVVTGPLGDVVFDDLVPSFITITVPMLGVYTWTAELLGVENFYLDNPAGSVTVRCRAPGADPFLLTTFIWPGRVKYFDVVCPACEPYNLGIRVEGTKTLTWYGGTVTLDAYPAVEGVPYTLVYPGPTGPNAVAYSNVWAGVQRFDGACCVLDDSAYWSGSIFGSCPRSGSVDLLWVVTLNDGNQCHITCWAMMSCLQPGPLGYTWPTDKPIGQAGTFRVIENGYRIHYGLGIVGYWGWGGGDPTPEWEPTFLEMSGGSLFPTSFAPPDPRIFGFSSSGYYAGTPTCLPVPQFPITVTD